MTCPFLREVVMAYCSAYPVKKMVPKDRMTEECACTCDDYTACSLFMEVMARLRTPDALGSDGLRPADSTAGGHGNPPRVPISVDGDEAGQPDSAPKEDPT